MTVQNQEAVQEALRRFGQKAENELQKAVNATATTVMNDIRKAIQGPPKTGRIYQRGTKTHQASAPGEAPANDTGALASAIIYTNPNPLTAIVAVRAGDINKNSKSKPLKYAYWLEYGTRKIKPRPSWRPAVEKNMPLFQKLIDAALRKAAQ
jgi:hypothetical protein